MALWNAGLDPSMALVAFGFTCVLSRRPHIAFVRPFTAICRLCSDITMSMVASSLRLSILSSTPDPPYPSLAKTHVAHVVKSHRLLSLVGSRVDCSLSISINTPPLMFPQGALF
ncbi:PREDICTED: uncharacterized protein LOC104725950 isoform X2 [Camelina sativa]|uniref:Uncharacterized protein LOC104725950 isoform X2 n=1 Tax=Camelina sativa TaxID=90675 RepID=A0ABM0ULR8_CAMSA|nr:PREDICTED: uncharacterized protein LOC104725950 isoform X2 [Camelina sativa]